MHQATGTASSQYVASVACIVRCIALVNNCYCSRPVHGQGLSRALQLHKHYNRTREAMPSSQLKMLLQAWKLGAGTPGWGALPQLLPHWHGHQGGNWLGTRGVPCKTAYSSVATEHSLAVVPSSSTKPTAVDMPQEVLQKLRRLHPLPAALQHNKQHLPAHYIPWVFSRHVTPLRHVANRMGFMMEALEREQEAVSHASKQIEPFNTGDVLEVRMRVPEVGGAEYTFRGLCIARYNKGIRTAFKLYNVYPESGGIVQHIPLHMPDLRSIKVVGKVRKRRSKLYYLLEGDKGGTYQQSPALVPVPGAEVAPKTQPVVAKSSSKKGGGKSKKT